ncbi:T9SS type A sorting domain-containing protein [Polaribacter septentrionalilitoris]|uniref:T9SS type A sorting domain-containing protein n=1 Tax=Polaribacter septentrionalilitoris TaxID=2494657 RepID=UPI0013572BA9|nr:T9SS type A sorting domain-containing protein [Polaribacter septentrionalilitoris]
MKLLFSKYQYLLLFCLICNVAVAQKASGNITFETNTPQTTIQAKATSLFANGTHTYEISGNTNEAISFENYSLEATASLETFFNNHKNHLILNNGSNLLHAIVKGNNAKAILYNTKGQQIKRLETQPFLENNTQIKASLTDLNNGVYIVKVQNNTGVNAFKILKTNRQVISKNSINKKQFSKTKTTTANYNISWNEQTQDVAGQIIITQAGNKAITLEDRTNNEITIPVTTISYFTGDVAVVPELRGSLRQNVKITLTNLSVTDSTYTKIVNLGESGKLFKNIYVRDATNPDQYEITIVDNRADATFLETKQTVDIYHDNAREINKTKIINLNEIPNEQDITFTIRDYKSLVIEPGVNIELIDKATGNVINTQVSDTQGEVIFEDVPGEGEYLTRTSKNGHYTKTVGVFITPKIDLVSEMVDFYNTTTIPIQFYSNGDQVTAEQAKQYKLLAVNTELLHGRENIYVPDVANRDFIIQTIKDMNTTLGFENATTFTTTHFGNPTQEQIDNYNAYGTLPYGNDVIGSNLENNGTDTNITGRSNGIFPGYSFNATDYQVGPAIKDIHHEKANKDGFQQIAQGSIISQSALDPTGGTELSMYDVLNMRMKLQIAKNHFVTTFNGKPAEYNYKTLSLQE